MNPNRTLESLGVVDRDCQGFQNTQGSGIGSVWVRVLVRAKIIAYITYIYLKIVFFHLKLWFWACINAYHIELECSK
jgi:hypothetical protein